MSDQKTRWRKSFSQSWVFVAKIVSTFYQRTRRLVELERLTVATRDMERKELVKNGGKDPDIVIKKPSQSLGGVTQKIIKVSDKFCWRS